MAGKPGRVRVVVVGAGVSGLAAALTLVQGGIKDVLVLEAAHRPGGRVRTINYGAHILEIGAQWIHGNEGNPIHDLAAARGLVRQELTGSSAGAPEMRSSPFLTLSGKPVSQDLVREVQQTVATILEKAAAARRCTPPLVPSDKSLDSFWDSELSALCRLELDSPAVKQLKIGLSKWHERLVCVQNACSSAADLSLIGYGEYEVGGTNEYCELEEGYQSVLDRVFLPGLGGYIKTNAPVTHVRLSTDSKEPGGVVVSFRDGSYNEVLADHVIISVPLGFLKWHGESFFSPPLPASKMSALASLQFGTVDKIYLIFENAFWDDSFCGVNFVWLPDDRLPELLRAVEAFSCKSEEQPWWRGLLGAYKVLKQPNVLEFWLSGSDAVAMEAVTQDDDVLFVCWKLLECFMGSALPKPVQVIRTAWSSAAYTYGSYTSLAPGSSAADIDSLAEPIECSGVPRILFAGEATCKRNFSTVHGAYISGVREASRLLSHYGKIGAPHSEEYPPASRL